MSAQPASCSRRVETFCGHTTRLSHVSVSSQCAGRAPPLPVPTLRTVHPFPGPTFAPDQLVVRGAWAGNCSVMHGCGVAYGDSGDCRRHHHRSAECAHHLRPVGRRLQASVCAPETRYGGLTLRSGLLCFVQYILIINQPPSVSPNVCSEMSRNDAFSVDVQGKILLATHILQVPLAREIGPRVSTVVTLVCTTQCFSKLQKEKEGKAETWLQLLGWLAQSLRAPTGSCEGLSQ